MIKTIYLFILCLLAGSSLVQAQDGHYWTQQFGPKSCLLSGAVVGGVRDYSASYYNPAGLAMGDSTHGVALNSNAYNLENITLLNAAGTGKNLTSNNMQIIPLIITGKLHLKQIPRLSIGYFMIENEKSNFKASARNTGLYNLIVDSVSPGNEEYVSQFNTDISLHEMVAGISLGYRLSEHFSVGLSNYGSYRRHTILSSHVARIVPTAPGLFFTSGYTRLEDIEFQNIRTTFKLAMMADFKRVKAGLTITLPSINVWGRAVVGMDESYSNIFLEGISAPISIFADDRQELKKTQYRDPLSVALGTELALSRSTILHLAGEWFAPLDTYTLIQPKDANFVKPSNAVYSINSAEYLRVREGRKSIVNLALGLEQKLTSVITLLLGGRTNFYSLVINPDDDVRLSHNNWNLYHVSLGASYHRKRSTIYLGFLGAYGTVSGQKQFINITEPTAGDNYPLQGDLTNTMTAKYRSLAGMLGYVFYIK